MEEVLRFMQNHYSFWLATVDGDRPRLRPFGFKMGFEGKLYFSTGSQKEVYRQLVKNPNVEACVLENNDEWVRISGRAVFDERPVAKARAFEEAPVFKGHYGSPDNQIFKLFYLEDAKAVFHKRGQEPREVRF